MREMGSGWLAGAGMCAHAQSCVGRGTVGAGALKGFSFKQISSARSVAESLMT